MDPLILGPLLILLFGAGVSAAFYLVARANVGRTEHPGDRAMRANDTTLQSPDTQRR